MNRRHFIRSTATLSLLPLGTAALAQSRALSSEGQPASSSFFLYDSRYPLTADALPALASFATWLPVQGDITQLWTTLLKHHSPQPLTLAGITAPSCHFCLQHLLRRQAKVKTDTTTIEHGLLAWWITSDPKAHMRRS